MWLQSVFLVSLSETWAFLTVSMCTCWESVVTLWFCYKDVNIYRKQNFYQVSTLCRFFKVQVGIFVFVPHWTLYRCLKYMWLGKRSVIRGEKTHLHTLSFQHGSIIKSWLISWRNKTYLVMLSVCQLLKSLWTHEPFFYHPLFALSRLLDTGERPGTLPAEITGAAVWTHSSCDLGSLQQKGDLTRSK